MRKTSQDGGDSTSITSGIENEIKKPNAALIKSKRNSIKRKVQTLSHESDDAVIEPLLHKEKEKSETVNQSAKFSMLKSKTDAHSRDGDKDKLLPDNKAKTSGLQEASFSSPSTKENIILFKSQPNSNEPLHTHMNTNVFSSIDTTKLSTTTKNQILVEIDGCKQGGFNPTPLIFTTAKIHTDSKTKQMEPVQVTAGPILSTTEIANTGKVKSSTGITQAMPGRSDTKTNEHFLISSTTFITGKDSKYSVPKTTSENKIQNMLIDRAVSNLLLNDSIKPPIVVADTTFSKSDPKKVEERYSETHASSKITESFIKDYPKRSQSPSSHYTNIKSAKSEPVSKVDSTVSDITGTSRKFKTDDVIIKLDKATVGKKDALKQQDGIIDENANASISAVQQLVNPDSDVKATPVDTKKYSDSAFKGKPSKEIASSSVNKQLPRQKNAIVEDADDSILKSKLSGSECLRYGYITQYSKDIDSVPTKLLRGANDISNKTLPKTSANNIIDTMTTKITATSIASKPISSFTTIVKPTVAASSQCIVTTGTMSTTTKPTFTNIPSTDIKSAVIPSSSGTISSKPQTTSSTTVIASTDYNKVLSSFTIKSGNSSVVTPSFVPGKINTASSVQSTIIDVPPLSSQNIITNTSNGSCHTSITLNPSTIKSVSTSSQSSSSAAKPVTTTPVAKSSASNKKDGPKTNEVNKDSMGLKAKQLK